MGCRLLRLGTFSRGLKQRAKSAVYRRNKWDGIPLVARKQEEISQATEKLFQEVIAVSSLRTDVLLGPESHSATNY